MKSSASTQFFRGTLAALDVAYLHPRFCRYVDFQDSTGDVVHRYLTEGSSEKLVMRDLPILSVREIFATSGGEATMKPLEGTLVVDFSQFLSGPSASLRLADLGARVVKIERPDGGDLCRQLYISSVDVDGDSTLFHSINRNKESFTADLKKPEDRDLVWTLLQKADVAIQNFRPGSWKSWGSTIRLSPRAIRASCTGRSADTAKKVHGAISQDKICWCSHSLD